MGILDAYRDFMNNSHDPEERRTLKEKVNDSMQTFKGNLKQPYSHISNSVMDESRDKGKAPISKRDIDKLTARSVTFPLFFIKTYNLIKKDLKLILRSRSSALIIFFGPLLLILLVGLAFNTSTLYSLKVASYAPNPNELTTSVLQGLDDEQYNVYTLDSVETCQQGVRSGEYHICIVFSETFEAGAAESTITYYVDESRANIASLIANTVNKRIRSASAELSKGFTTDIISVLDFTSQAVEKNLDTINTLISLNSDASLQLDEAKETLGELDLSFNTEDYNFTGVEDTIAFYEAENNNATFSKLRNALADLELEFLILEERLEEARQSAQSTTSDIQDVQGKFSGASDSLTQVREDLVASSNEIKGIEVTDTGVIVEPIKSEVKPLTQDRTHLNFLFPTLLVLLVMFISILLSSTVVMKEKNSKAFFRNFINPTGDFLYLLGTYLTAIILVILQLLILVLAALYFKQELIANFWPLLGTLAVVATVFILLGVAIGYIFKTEETSILGSIAVATIFLLFSNTVLPIETLPSPFREVVQFNPFIIAESLVKQILLFNASLVDLYLEFAYLGIFIIGLFVIAYVGRLVSKRRA